MYLAIKHFRHYVEGREFFIVMDYKPLTHVLSTHSKQHSPCQVPHLDFITQFTSDIRYISGTANTAANALSCMEVDALHTSSSGINFKAMAEAQVMDPLQTGAAHPSHSHETSPNLQYHSFCDMSTIVRHPLVLPQFRCQVFDTLISPILVFVSPSC